MCCCMRRVVRWKEGRRERGKRKEGGKQADTAARQAAKAASQQPLSPSFLPSLSGCMSDDDDDDEERVSRSSFFLSSELRLTVRGPSTAFSDGSDRRPRQRNLSRD